jgi:hypothetical protein
VSCPNAPGISRLKDHRSYSQRWRATAAHKLCTVWILYAFFNRAVRYGGDQCPRRSRQPVADPGRWSGRRTWHREYRIPTLSSFRRKQKHYHRRIIAFQKPPGRWNIGSSFHPGAKTIVKVDGSLPRSRILLTSAMQLTLSAGTVIPRKRSNGV